MIGGLKGEKWFSVMEKTRWMKKWRDKWQQRVGRKLVRIKVIKVDGKTMNTNDYPTFVIEGSEEQMLNSAKKSCNVGDFIIIGDKAFRRIRGGFRECTDDDLSELLASQLC